MIIKFITEIFTTMKKPLITLTLIIITLAAFTQTGPVSNVNVQQRFDGSGLVDINYDLNGQGSTYDLTVKISFDGGSSYNTLSPEHLEGDINGVSPGNGKHILWNGLASHPEIYSTQSRIKITADEVGGGSSGQPCPGMPTFTDPRDGQTYNTVQIGDQCWMKENLNYQVSDSWCYDNNTTNCDNYGRLYTWHAAMAGASSSNSNPSGVQGVCPPGWHLPSDAEWTELVNYVVSQGFPNSNVTNGAGNALKSCRQVGSPLGGDCDTGVHPRWNSHGTHYGFDEFGFSALPGGFRNSLGSFLAIGINGFWWSSTDYAAAGAWGRSMYRGHGDVARFGNLKTTGFSLRCVRD